MAQVHDREMTDAQVRKARAWAASIAGSAALWIVAAVVVFAR